MDEEAVDALLLLIDDGLRGEGVVVEAPGERDHLHDRPGLVGLGHREIAEVGDIRACVVVGVVGRILRPRIDGAGLGVHDHQRPGHRVRGVDAVGERQLGTVLDLRVEPKLQVIAIPGRNHLLLAEHDGVAVDIGERGLVAVHSGEDAVVVPLHPVLAHAVGVDEAEQVRGKRDAGDGRRVVDALLGRDGADAAQPECLELVVHVLGDALGEVVELIGLIQRLEDLRRAHLQDRRKHAGDLLAIRRGDQRGIREHIEDLDIAHQDAPLTVEDHAARCVQRDRRRVRRGRCCRQRLALDHLDLHQAAEHRRRHREEYQHEPETAAAEVGSAAKACA